MAIKPRDIYKGAKKTHRAAKIVTAILVLLVVGTVALFFGLRHCCIYDDEGNATLILPTTKENRELLRAYKEALAAQPPETPAPTPAPEDSPSPDEPQQPGESDVPEGGDPDASPPPEGGEPGDSPPPEGSSEPVVPEPPQ